MSDAPRKWKNKVEFSQVDTFAYAIGSLPVGV
jgi:hypothetical protein